MRIFDEPLALPKNFKGGTHRMRSPKETVEHFRPLMPKLGITRLANLTGLEIGLRSYRDSVVCVEFC